MSEPILPPGATLRDAIRAIEETQRFIAAVVGDDGKLLGILSDGDIRRAILAGRGLDSPAADSMTRNPIRGPASAHDNDLAALMTSRSVAAIPVVDDGGRFVRVACMGDFAAEGVVSQGGEGYAAAVIMAGGEGRRLRPLTLDRPKPMIPVGGVPLLERQVRAMVGCGLKRIFISTNYLGHIIEDHFGDGAAFGANIRYLREANQLGTAGALSLLPEIPDGPLLVINGDVLTTSDFGKLLSFHDETRASITVSAMIYRIEIPFGVLSVDGHRAVRVEEKPSQSFLCNAGIYVLTPDVVGLVTADTRLDMTDVIATALERDMTVSVFPIHEFWSDIGSPHDLEQALAEFAEVSRT
jgi:dTDP-glucose pyrophosphorylase